MRELPLPADPVRKTWVRNMFCYDFFFIFLTCFVVGLLALGYFSMFVGFKVFQLFFFFFRIAILRGVG